MAHKLIRTFGRRKNDRLHAYLLGASLTLNILLYAANLYYISQFRNVILELHVVKMDFEIKSQTLKMLKQELLDLK